jgi:predicted GIY-YIG superfamily endonuclease
MINNVKGTCDIVNIYVVLLDGEEVYVGYSRDLKERWCQYKSSYNCEHSHTHQEIMTQYMKLHGWYNFSIQLV